MMEIPAEDKISVILLDKAIEAFENSFGKLPNNIRLTRAQVTQLHDEVKPVYKAAKSFDRDVITYRDIPVIVTD